VLIDAFLDITSKLMNIFVLVDLKELFQRIHIEKSNDDLEVFSHLKSVENLLVVEVDIDI